VPLNPWC